MADGKKTVGRFEFWKDAFWRPAGALVAVPYAASGLLAFVRDEVVQPSNVAAWKPIYWLAMLPWYWWAILTLAVAVGVLFEGAYRLLARERNAALDLQAKLSNRPRLRALAKSAWVTVYERVPDLTEDAFVVKTRPVRMHQVYVAVTNDTPASVTNTVADVIATVRFLNPDLPEMLGMWVADGRISPESRVVLAVGDTRNLTVAMRSDGKYTGIPRRDSSLMDSLGDGPFCATLRVRGATVDQSWRIEFAEEGEGLAVSRCEAIPEESASWARA